ncbi:aminotransferase class V-fold PLP-dependent enzyme [Cryobacterium breve]|uniref:aminotransferase class V-fold PLP-dependent enzyme n=1 Tax=Cryobacterium breve TaxID=1259258 RepID=UPI00248C9878|nr:aminotransferase class V-fold PLP-dependent enzyme [Cryobacterium breve]
MHIFLPDAPGPDGDGVVKRAGLFGRGAAREAAAPVDATNRLADFDYLEPREVYLDAACQSLRPQPVIDAVNEYYTSYNACGGRVKYAWGKRVDEEVAATRAAVLDRLGLSARSHAVSFTLNTTYGINLLLQQPPQGRFGRVVTSHAEHNSVFLPTMTAAKRLGLPRLVLDRAPDGALVYDPAQARTRRRRRERRLEHRRQHPGEPRGPRPGRPRPRRHRHPRRRPGHGPRARAAPGHRR